MADFEDVVLEARELEKKQLQYSPYKDAVALENTLDLDPKEYVDLTYEDMINLYERTQKINKASNLGVFASVSSTATTGYTDKGMERKVVEETAELPTELEIETEKPIEEATSKKRGKEIAPPVSSAKADQVEEMLKQMTTETLETAEQVSKETIQIERKPELQGAEHEEKLDEVSALANEIELEFERVSKEEPGGKSKTVTTEEPETPAHEIEIEHREERETAEKEQHKEAEKEEAERSIDIDRELGEKEFEPKKVEREKLTQRAQTQIAPRAGLPEREERLAPPALQTEERFERMEEQVKAAVDEKADPIEIKKKMLELTKQLFKEKTTSKREEIKLQISVLKNMLTSPTQGTPGGRRAAGGEDNQYSKLYQTMLDTHQAELAQAKDMIVDSYNKQIATIKRKFHDDMVSSDDTTTRNQVFDAFAFSVTSLAEQLPGILNKYAELNSKKHTAEIEKLLQAMDGGSKAIRKLAEERLEYVKTNYATEFDPVKLIIAKEVENLIDVAGAEIFKDEGSGMQKEAKAYEALREINELSEGALLSYLQNADGKDYLLYQNKKLSKAEALFKAKRLMAEEKELSGSIIKKYFEV